MNFVRNGVYMGIASAGSGIFLLAAYAVVARLVPKIIFGEYQMAGTFVAIAALAAYPKMPNALITAAARGAYGTFPAAISAVFKKSAYGIATLLFLSIYYAMTGHYGLAASIVASTLFFAPYIISGFYESYCVGRGEIRAYALWSLMASAIVSCALVASSLIFPTSAAALAFGFFCASAATTGVWAYRASTSSAVQKAPVSKEVLAFGKKTSWTEALLYCTNYADIILINAFLGPREVAIYGIARMAPEGIKGLVKNLGVLAAARIATMEKLAVRNILTPRLAQSALIAFGMTISYIALAPLLFSVIFPTYPEAIIYSQLLAVSFLAFPAHLIESALGALLQKKETIILNAGGAFSMLTLSLLLIPNFGIMGAVAARVLARFINAGIALFLAMRFI